MNTKAPLILGSVLATLVVLGAIVLALVQFAGLTFGYSLPSVLPEPNSEVITARVIEDLAVSADPASEVYSYVLKFYKGNDPISSYIAVPPEKIGVSSDGKLIVPIFDGTDIREGVIYVAEVIEDPAYMHAADNPNRPPFIGPAVYEGFPCFFEDDEKIESCIQDKSNLAVLDWSPDNSDIFPPWQEGEAYGPLLFLEEFQNTNSYVRKHVTMDRSQLATIPDVNLGIQPYTLSEGVTTEGE